MSKTTQQVRAHRGILVEQVLIDKNQFTKSTHYAMTSVFASHLVDPYCLSEEISGPLGILCI